MLLGSHILIGIVEIQPELLHHAHKSVRVFRRKMDQRHGTFQKGILREIQQEAAIIQPCQNQPDRVEGKVGEKQSAGFG